MQTLEYGEERLTQSLRCEGFENYEERRITTPKHTKHTNTKLCGMNDLEMVEREGGRANSGGRKQLTEEEVGCMCIEVICNCVEVEVVHK